MGLADHLNEAFRLAGYWMATVCMWSAPSGDRQVELRERGIAVVSVVGIGLALCPERGMESLGPGMVVVSPSLLVQPFGSFTILLLLVGDGTRSELRLPQDMEILDRPVTSLPPLGQ